MPAKLGNTTWYTVQEVADCLGKSFNTIYARLKEGQIPYSEVSNNKVVSHKDLVKALDNENLPESIIEYRLGEKSPKTDKKLKSATA